MSGATKEQVKLSRAQAGQRLETLAAQVMQGTITVGTKTIRVPDRVRLEIKADSDELELELKWRPSDEPLLRASAPAR